ncbi:hypothetical protein [Mobilicoccus pelagius]|uniref:DUF4124 domain-containing protein n=1 Tax=Mobilicoccus pelagius NBRC 104925 TaxID=1089455 RepID=H5UMR3_9MICO|nr:hypothetical protein [Mobilicoccus pelagius]GAB47021.1 hypothetical protein MOPEL_003_00440 [Mobilicoccus pelagius NBRC 104925]
MTPPPRRHVAVGLATLVVVLVATLVGISILVPDSPEPGPAPTASPTPTAGQRGVYPSFGDDDVFSVDVRNAPVHPDSAAMNRNLRGQIDPNYGGVVGLNTTHYNPVLYVVDETTPRVRVEFDDCQKKGYTPTDLFDGRKQFVDVPVPADAQTSVGTDSTITLWSPSTDQLWEFWVMKRTKSGGWSACWGGRIDDVSSSPGYFPNPFGVSASGLVTTGSMITLKEAREGRIDHAMGMALLRPARWDRVWYPAQRSDGTDPSPHAIPEGARLRLDPAVDVESLDLTPLGKAVARAAQTYGFVVVDTAGAVAVMAESSLPEQKATGTDPWEEILGGVPHYKQLENFPWDRVQVVEESYGKPGG